MGTKFKITKERLVEIQEELAYLQTVREKEVAELIKEARSFGDLSENSEYDEAKTEQGKLYSKIAELKKIVENVEIIEKSAKTGMVTIGSTVTILDVEVGEEETYYIVGSQEANPMQQKISDDSPMGTVLVGGKVGDVVTVQAPGGEFAYKIIKIEK